MPSVVVRDLCCLCTLPWFTFRLHHILRRLKSSRFELTYHKFNADFNPNISFLTAIETIIANFNPTISISSWGPIQYWMETTAAATAVAFSCRTLLLRKYLLGRVGGLKREVMEKAMGSKEPTSSVDGMSSHARSITVQCWQLGSVARRSKTQHPNISGSGVLGNDTTPV